MFQDIPIEFVRSEAVMKATQVLDNHIAGLSLQEADYKMLVDLIIIQLKEAERNAFVLGLTSGVIWRHCLARTM